MIKENKKILYPIIVGILASIFWIIGDLLIVGFTPMPEKYPLLSETYASQLDVDFAIVMLSGSTRRLMWGALIAVFSIPLYLYSVFAFFHIVKPKFNLAVVILLFVGFAYAPLGHAAFFYVGEIYKAIVNTDVSAHPQLLETASGFMKVLKLNWSISLIFSSLGWFVYGIFVLIGKSSLKKRFFFVNPITFILLIMLVTQFLQSSLKDWIACAIFNEANFIFFVILLIMNIRELKMKNV